MSMTRSVFRNLKLYNCFLSDSIQSIANWLLKVIVLYNIDHVHLGFKTNKISLAMLCIFLKIMVLIASQLFFKSVVLNWGVRPTVGLQTLLLLLLENRQGSSR